jgi:hypothetical protein
MNMLAKGDKVRLLVPIEYRWSLVKERNTRDVISPGVIGEITKDERIHWQYTPETAFTKFLGYTVKFIVDGLPPVWIQLRSSEIELVEMAQA